ncbi:MAG: radical SAM protein [bacterium]
MELSNMKILLIWPPSPDYCVLTEDFSCCEPLPLEYLGAPLMDKYDIDIIDMRFEKDDIRTIIKKTNPNLIGLSVPYSVVVHTCNRLLEAIKNDFPAIKIVIGGHHPTVTLYHLNLEYVDYILTGEAVETFHSLVDNLSDNKPLIDIPNLYYYNHDGKLQFTYSKDIESIDVFPAPDRKLLKKYSNLYFHAHYDPVSLIRFSYGCPYNCSFCILWKLCNRRYLTRQNEKIIEELKSISNKNIYVVDDEAFIDVKKMHALADRINEAKIQKKYHMYVRSDSVVRNPDLFKKWAEIGLDSVLIGLESIYEKELKIYRKKISLNMAYQCVEILHSYGIEIRANFIVRQDYTKVDFANLLKEVKRLNIDRPTFAVLTPFFGTDDYFRLKDQFIINKLEFFDCFHTFLKTELPLKEFYFEFANLFKYSAERKSKGAIFYEGKNSSFDSFINKIQSSYEYYENYNK